MKRYITKEDLAQLTESQKVSLRELWLPEKYDRAIAYICKNAETEEYDEIDFVVGNILLHRTHITLIDIRHPMNEKGESEEDDSNQSGVADEEEMIPDEKEFDLSNDDSEEMDFDDEDFEFEYERPTTFSKEDCLPLLGIPQMIEIFERRDFKDINFYLTASADEKGCAIGNSDTSLETYGSSFEPAELCDVLWENLKQLL